VRQFYQQRRFRLQQPEPIYDDLLHKFNDDWHISFEGWQMHEYNTPNAASPFYGASPYMFFTW